MDEAAWEAFLETSEVQDAIRWAARDLEKWINSLEEGDDG